MSDKNAQSEILKKYIQKIAEKMIDGSGSSYVKTGIIKSSELGYYKVQLMESGETDSVDAVNLYTNTNFVKGDWVYLISADVKRGNTFKTDYFIVNTVDKIQHQFDNLTDWERLLAEDTTFNDSVEHSIGFTKDGFITEDPIATLNSGNNAAILNAVRLQGTIGVSAVFTTLNSEDTKNPYLAPLPTRTNYGLKVVITYEDDTKEAFYLDTPWFNGQPFNLNNSEQHRTFRPGAKAATAKEIKIFAFVDKDWETKNTNYQISVSNLVVKVGTLFFTLNDFSVKVRNTNGKIFLNKSQGINSTDKIVLQATPEYNGQVLDNASLKYFWFIKDDSITENSDGYNILGGAGWRILNEQKLISFANGEQKQSYKSDSNEIELTHSPEVLSKYKNIIKCVVQYQLATAESDDFEVYNFNYEDFDASIELTKGELPLLYVDESVTLTCSVTSKTVDINASKSYEYIWYAKQAENSEYALLEYKITEKKEDGTESIVSKNYIEKTLNIKVTENPSTEEFYSIGRDVDKIKFKCEVKLSDNVIAEPQFEVKSSVSVTENIVPVTYYEYIISTGENGAKRSFQQELINKDEKEKEIDPYYKWIDSANISWVSTNDENQLLKDEEGLKWLNTDKDTLGKGLTSVGDKCWVYYTSQVRHEDHNKTRDNGIYPVVRYDDYTKPAIIRELIRTDQGIKDSKTQNELEQLNTFNELTNNGKEQGIYYDEELYTKTRDTIVDENKLKTGRGYYKKNQSKKYSSVTESNKNGIEQRPFYTRINNDFVAVSDEEVLNATISNGVYYYLNSISNIYTLGSNLIAGEELPSINGKDTYWYEKSGDKLFINAEYIQTGALQVGPTGNERFYASYDNENVKIGGFYVGNDRIYNNNFKLVSSVPEINFNDNIVIRNNYMRFGENDEDAKLLFNTNGLKIKGHIEADTGKIGLWNIYEDGKLGSVLNNKETKYGIVLDPNPDSFDTITDDCPEGNRVFAIGELPGGVNGTFGNAGFHVHANGKLVATGAEITGKIKATSGWFGDASDNIKIMPTDHNSYILYSDNFKVTKAGKAELNNATIAGGSLEVNGGNSNIIKIQSTGDGIVIYDDENQSSGIQTSLGYSLLSIRNLGSYSDTDGGGQSGYQCAELGVNKNRPYLYFYGGNEDIFKGTGVIGETVYFGKGKDAENINETATAFLSSGGSFYTKGKILSGIDYFVWEHTGKLANDCGISLNVGKVFKAVFGVFATPRRDGGSVVASTGASDTPSLDSYAFTNSTSATQAESHLSAQNYGGQLCTSYSAKDSNGNLYVRVFCDENNCNNGFFCLIFGLRNNSSYLNTRNEIEYY